MAQGNEYIDWSLDSTSLRPLGSDVVIKKLVNGEWSRYASPALVIPNYNTPWSFIYNEGGDRAFHNDFVAAQEQTARDFFDKYIFPLARRTFRIWGVENLNDPNLTVEKNLYDAWEKQLDPSVGFKSMRFSAQTRINFNDIDFYYTSNGGVVGETDVEYLSNVFGWSDFANSNQDVGTDIANIGALTNLNQEEKKRAKAALLNAVKGDQSDAPAPTVEQLNALKQCALMSDLLHKGWSYSSYPSTWTKNGQAFDGRIYPVTIQNRIDPNELINLCTVPRDIKLFFNDKTKNSDILWWSLHWVYNDSEGLKDAKIYLKSDDPNNDYDPVRDLVNQGLLSHDQLKKWNRDRTTKGYTFKEIQIDYDGTNPSTARSDVKVTMTIEMDHINSLDTVCAYGDVIEQPAHTPPNLQGLSSKPAFRAKGGAAQVRLVDLITIPQVKTVDVTTPGGRGYHKNTFTPETSRIRLKVWYDEEAARNGQATTYTTETALILDLALVDHEIKRHDDAQNKTTLTITYRGYFEESMNAPYNDAIVTSTIIQNRADREGALNEAAKRKCGDKLLREMQRLVAEQNRAETQQYLDSGGLIAALMNKDKVYTYEIDQTLFNAGKIGNYLLTDYQYVDLNSVMKLSTYLFLRQNIAAQQSVVPSTTSPYAQSQAQRQQTLSDKALDYSGLAPGAGNFYERTAASLVNMFVMLGDLIDFALDSLYKPGTNTHYSHTKDMNMRFIVGTIKIPDPSDPTKSLIINPLQIPIDIAFFSSWYHDTIVKKGITSYAVGPFIKDLLERLVNDVIYDSCFSALTVDENPPQIRTCYFSDHSGKWFDWSNSNKNGTLMQINAAGNNLPGNTDAWFDPKDPYATGYTPRILMKKDIDAPVSDSRNYCVIYQQFPSYFRQIRSASQQRNSLSAQPTTIDIYDGYNNKYNNFCSYTTFTKANPSSYLREARYFNNNFGVLALIANVYDLSFKIQTKKMNTCFYPGNIINFIVTDFGPSSFVDPVSTPLGESNPHKANTRANILGYGGYYIITKVSYLLEDVQAVGSATISITCKFLGTDANLSIAKNNAVEDIFINEPQECVDAYNDQLNNLRVIDPAAANAFSIGVTTSESSAPINELPGFSEPPPSQRITTATTQTSVRRTADLLLAGTQFVRQNSNLAVGVTKTYQVGDIRINVKMNGFVRAGVALSGQSGVVTPSANPATVTDQAQLTITASDGRTSTILFPVN